MKFWKNWPYWLRGGVVATILGILSVVAADFCENTLLAKADPRNDMADIACIIYDGPGLFGYYIVSNIAYFVPSLENVLDSGSVTVESTIVVFSWTLTGILIGLFISWLKKRKQRKLNQV